MKAEGESGVSDSSTIKEWKWPENTKISSDGALVNTGIQFVRMENDNKTIVVQMNYKATVSPATLDYIYFRFDPRISDKIKSITSNVGWGITREMKNVYEITEENPYSGTDDAENIWRVSLDKPGEGIFTSIPVATSNYDRDFVINLNQPLTDEEMKSLYSIELRIMGKEKGQYTISKRTMDNKIVIKPIEADKGSGNWLQGSTFISTYESQGELERYDKRGTERKNVQIKKLDENQGFARFRYKYFPNHPYNLATGAKKPYQMEVKISENALDAMIPGEKVYVQARLAGSKFANGTYLTKEDFGKSNNGFYTAIVSEAKGTATDTRDYLQPETGSGFVAMTDIIIPINEAEFYEKAEGYKTKTISTQVRFIDKNGKELKNSKSMGFITITQTEPPTIYNIEKINEDQDGDEILIDDKPGDNKYVNKARITQNSLKGKTERAGVIEKPDPNDDKQTIVETVPTRVLVKSSTGGQPLGDGFYKADEDGNFEIVFDKTFEEMGFKAGDKIKVEVYAIAAGKTVSDAREITLEDEATNPLVTEESYRVLANSGQILGDVDRHLYGTDFKANIKIVDKNKDSLIEEDISSENVSVSPEGKVTINLSNTLNENLVSGNFVTVKLTEDSYSISAEKTIPIIENPADVSELPTINEPVKNTDTSISGTGIPGSTITINIPGVETSRKVTVGPTGIWELKDLDLTDKALTQITITQKEKNKRKPSGEVGAVIEQDENQLFEIQGRYFVEIANGEYQQVDVSDASNLKPKNDPHKLYVRYKENNITLLSKARPYPTYESKYSDGENTFANNIVNVVPKTENYVLNEEKTTLPMEMDFGVDAGERIYDVYYDANRDSTYTIKREVYYIDGETTTLVPELSISRKIPKAFNYELTDAGIATIETDPYYVFDRVENKSIPHENNTLKITSKHDGEILKVYFEKVYSDDITINEDITDISKEITITGYKPNSKITLKINGVPVEGITVSDSRVINLPEGVNLKPGDKVVVEQQEKFEKDGLEAYKAPAVSNEVTVGEAEFDSNNVVKLKITTPPNKTNYEYNESFDPTGMEVTLTDENGKIKVISSNELDSNGIKITTKPDDIEGRETVIVYYGTGDNPDGVADALKDDGYIIINPQEAYKYTPTVDDVYEDSKEIVVRIDKEAANPTINLILPSGETKKLTEYTVSDTEKIYKYIIQDADGIRKGETVQATAVEGSDSPSNTSTIVKERPFNKDKIKEIKITKMPNKTEYNEDYEEQTNPEDSKFNPEGMEVTLIDENGKEQVVPYEEFDDYNLTFDPDINKPLEAGSKIDIIHTNSDNETITTEVPITINTIPVSVLPVVSEAIEGEEEVSIIATGAANGTTVKIYDVENPDVVIAEGTMNDGKIDLTLESQLEEGQKLRVVIQEPNKKPNESIKVVTPLVQINFKLDRETEEVKATTKGKAGSIITLPEEPSGDDIPNGKRFKGWVLENGTALVENSKFPSEDMTAYAVFEDNDATTTNPVIKNVVKDEGSKATEEDIKNAISGLPLGSKISNIFIPEDTSGDVNATATITYPDGSSEKVEIPIKYTGKSAQTEITRAKAGETVVEVSLADGADITSSATLSIKVTSGEESAYYRYEDESGQQKEINPGDKGPFLIKITEKLKSGDKIIAALKETGKTVAKSEEKTVEESKIEVLVADVLTGNDKTEVKVSPIGEEQFNEGDEITIKIGEEVKDYIIKSGEENGLTIPLSTKIENGTEIKVDYTQFGQDEPTDSVTIIKTAPAEVTGTAKSGGQEILIDEPTDKSIEEITIKVSDTETITLKNENGFWKKGEETLNPVGDKLSVSTTNVIESDSIEVVSKDNLGNTTTSKIIPTSENSRKPKNLVQTAKEITAEVEVSEENPIEDGTKVYLVDENNNKISSIDGRPIKPENNNTTDTAMTGSIDEYGKISIPAPTGFNKEKLDGKTVKVLLEEPRKLPTSSENLVLDTLPPKMPEVSIDSENNTITIDKPTDDTEKITITIPGESEKVITLEKDSAEELGWKINPSVEGYTLEKDDNGVLKITSTDPLPEEGDLKVKVEDEKGNYDEKNFPLKPKLENTLTPKAKVESKPGKGTTVTIDKAPAEQKFEDGDTITINGTNYTIGTTEGVTLSEDGSKVLVKVDLPEDKELEIKVKVSGKDYSEIVEPKPVVPVDKSEAEKAQNATPEDLKDKTQAEINSMNDGPDKDVADAYKDLEGVLNKTDPKPTQKDIDDATDALNKAIEDRAEAKVAKVEKSKTQEDKDAAQEAVNELPGSIDPSADDYNSKKKDLQDRLDTLAPVSEEPQIAKVTPESENKAIVVTNVDEHANSLSINNGEKDVVTASKDAEGNWTVPSDSGYTITKSDDGKTITITPISDEAKAELEDKTITATVKNTNAENDEGKTSEGVLYNAEANEPVTPPSTVDKSELKNAVNNASTVKGDDKYKNASPEKQQAYNDAITAGQAVLDNEEATQEEVDTAKKAIDDAEKALNGQPSPDEPDTSGLEASINEDKNTKNSDKYKNASEDKKKAYNDALEEAKKVLNDPNATQDDIDNTKNALDQARNNLDGTSDETEDDVNKDGLGNSINDGDRFENTSDYLRGNPDDKDAYDEAKREAERVFNDPNATQDEVDRAKRNLDDAIRRLERGSRPDTRPDYDYNGNMGFFIFSLFLDFQYH